MNSVHTKQFDSSGKMTANSYHEFLSEIDGPALASALLKEYGTKAACVEEMLYMTIVAASRNDLTTINGLACVRKYWRDNPD